ncbi:DUF2726 domain-containing protein [Roseicyclus marinus]|uniref:DUF2726 domain-containing protein n=1 Tax=Roseicyclus marinus TaxID=2161673 RepID=UPI00240EBE99|nr:DUF2726 domain-containing protein [Roseicyclus marinus]MDG3042138.1 DUF2726 domain-containing protein [Roseicyclus marinus]
MLTNSPFADVLEAMNVPWTLLIVPVLLAFAIAVVTLAARKGGKGRKSARRADTEVLASMSLTARPLLNRSEGQVFNAIEAELRKVRGGHRLLAQVSVGEVLTLPRGARRSDRQIAFNMINAKRFDFLIVDQNWCPLAALEYHGRGHDQKDASKRDKIKRIACKAAGLPLIEIPANGLDPRHIGEIRRCLSLPMPIAAE